MTQNHFEGLFLVLILTKANNKGVSKWRPKRLPPCQPIIESCDDAVPNHTELRNCFLFDISFGPNELFYWPYDEKWVILCDL